MTAPFPIPLPLEATLLRPRLLMRAARIGLAEYRRDRDLGRILPQALFPALRTARGADFALALARQGAAVLDWLVEEEARLDAARLGAQAGYSPLRHIEVMIALLAELRLTRAG